MAALARGLWPVFPLVAQTVQTVDQLRQIFFFFTSFPQLEAHKRQNLSVRPPVLKTFLFRIS